MIERGSSRQSFENGASRTQETMLCDIHAAIWIHAQVSVVNPKKLWPIRYVASADSNIISKR